MEDVFIQLFSCGEERKAKSKALIQSRFYCDLFSLEPPPPSFLHFVNQFGKNILPGGSEKIGTPCHPRRFESLTICQTKEHSALALNFKE